MGIDHSNPYIHSTTVLCDIHFLALTSLHRLQKMCFIHYDGDGVCLFAYIQLTLHSNCVLDLNLIQEWMATYIYVREREQERLNRTGDWCLKTQCTNH